MVGSFSFNAVESSTFNLVCKSVKRPLLPAAKLNRTEIVSASGTYDFGESEYSLRPVIMRIAYIGTSYEELRTRARQIAAWLSTKTWAKLIINDEPDKYYLAKVTGEIDLQNLWESGTADIAFDCQPFAYSVAESEVAINPATAGDHVFNNPGTREINFKSPQGSKSLITINGSWTTLSLTMNGATLSYLFAGVNSELIINNADMEVTKDGLNIFNNMTGDIDEFFSIIPGDNTLTVSGSGLNITITIKFIPMWM